jgi:1-acyl-sn-glycerol-3-phosphate acyltransferase
MEWEFKPARDQGLSPAERLRSPWRERSLGGLALGGAWRLCVRAYLRAYHRLTVDGAENLPKNPPYVLVGNHSSHLDALVLASIVHGAAGRRVHALAAGDTFFANPRASLFAAYAVNALPVWRRARGALAGMRVMRERLLADSLVYVLFPEGTRSRTGVMGPFHGGLGLLVAGTEVPVVPCWIEGAFSAWPPDASFPRARKLIVRIGTPMAFSATANDPHGWTEIAAACEIATRKLGGA